jgi:SGF29 tudor-like domain
LEKGDQVAAKFTQEWILAYVVSYLSDKNKYEIEDAEEEEDHPGTKR